MSAEKRPKDATAPKKSQVTRVGKYILLDTLGQGAFGKVKLAVNEETGHEYAIKIMAKSDIKAHELTLQVRREIAVMKALRHPNIVNLHEVLNSSKNLYMVMDLVTGGELFDVVAAQKRLPENQARGFFQQLVDGIEYCHSRRVYHRDLKPENLLVSEDKKTLKITDFGLSSIKEQNASSELLHTIMGSPHYIPPEIITSAANGYEGDKVDTWASGMILFGMLAGYLPFDNPDTNELYRAIVHSPVEYPKHFSNDVVKMLRAMLQKDPSKRANMNEVKTFPWFQVGYTPSLPVTPRNNDEKASKKKPRKRHHRKKISDTGATTGASFDTAESTDLNAELSMDAQVVIPVASADVEALQKQLHPESKQRRMLSRLGRKSTRESSDVSRKSSHRKEGRDSKRDLEDRAPSRDRGSQKSDSSASDLRRQLSSQSSSRNLKNSADESESAAPVNAEGVQRKKSFGPRKHSEVSQHKTGARKGFLHALTHGKQPHLHPFRRTHERKTANATISQSLSEQFADSADAVTKVDSDPLSLGELAKATAKFNRREVSDVSPLKDTGPVLFTTQSYDVGARRGGGAFSKAAQNQEVDREGDRRRSTNNRTHFSRKANGSRVNSEAYPESPWSDYDAEKQKPMPKNVLDVAGTLFADLTSPTSPPGLPGAEECCNEFSEIDDQKPVQSLPPHMFNTPTQHMMKPAIGMMQRKHAVFRKSQKRESDENGTQENAESPRILRGVRSKTDNVIAAEAVAPEKAEQQFADRVTTDSGSCSIFKPTKFMFACNEENSSEVADSPHVLCPPRYFDENDEYPQWCLDSNDVFADAEDEPPQLRGPNFTNRKADNEGARANGVADGNANAAKKPIFAPLNSKLERNLSKSTNEVTLEASVAKKLDSLPMYAAKCE